MRRVRRTSMNTWVLLSILGLFVLAIWILSPSGSTSLDREKGNLGMRLGLDLAGGAHFLYQADFREEWTDAEREFHLDRALITIRDRIDKYGVAEPVIQKQGGDRILVQLPGLTNVTEARELIEQTGFLEFREVELKDNRAVRLSDYLDEPDRTEFFDTSVGGTRLFARIDTSEDDPDEKITLPYVLEKDADTGELRFLDETGAQVDRETVESEGPTDLYSWMPAVGELNDKVEPLTGAFLDEALPYIPPPTSIGEQISVNITWESEGADLFDQIAARLFKRYSSSVFNIEAALGIFLDGEVISTPQILQSEYKGEGSITGNFNWEEARLLAIQLDSGALSMPLKKPPISETEVSATLGSDFIDRAILAGAIGLGMVILFMILYYRLLGVLASLALLVYVALVLAIFKLIPVTLTLAGLAGFVLSIGMAVDANVLIFERLKEELRAGRTLKAAVETGFNRAWTAIRDSNVSTIIICGILYWFGSKIVNSPAVMGFAVTLFFGVMVSMFSAIVVTRTLLRFSTGLRAAKRLSWFGVEAKDV